MFHWSFKKTKNAVQGVNTLIAALTVQPPAGASRPRPTRLRPPPGP